ncbi:hypothetical protein UlMin_028068 [Ulmus minor]
MKSRKVIRSNDIPIEAWKCLGEVGIQWLTRLFNRILETRKMPDSWRNSIVVPINKGDIQNYSNYRGIKLMNHTMKLWERVIKKKVSHCYVDIIKDMYEGAATSVRSVGGMSNEFSVSVGLHQG